jgi:hypothetical protein
MAAALARRTGLVRADPEVVLAGGVFRTDDARFHERLAAGIRGAVPAATLARLAGPPVAGAALIGLDRLNGGIADEAAAGRVRDALTAWSATGGVVTPS